MLPGDGISLQQAGLPAHFSYFLRRLAQNLGGFDTSLSDAVTRAMVTIGDTALAFQLDIAARWPYIEQIPRAFRILIDDQALAEQIIALHRHMLLETAR